MKNSTSLKPQLAFRFLRADNIPVKNQYLPVIMPGLSSERNSLEFCHDVKVEIIKYWTTSQFKFTFKSDKIFKHKINHHIQLFFLSVKSVKTLH